MDLKQLLYFKTIVEEGSILSASKKLFMSQPPLSKQIQLLEEELNCKLFERGARQIVLTNEGKYLYEQAKTLLSLSDITKEEIINLSKSDRGSIRIGIVSSTGSYVLEKYLIPFHKKYPLVKFEISEANTYQLIEKLNANLIDIAIVRTPFDDSGLKVIKLIEEKLVVIGNKEYFKNKNIVLKDIESLPLVIYRRWENILLKEFNKRKINPNIVCINDDARTTMAWVNSKNAITIVPNSASLFMNDDCEMLEIEDLDISSNIVIIHKNNAHLSKITNLFIENNLQVIDNLK